jgi:cytochrome P450
VCIEQDAVASKYGTTLTPGAYAAMSYTLAAVKETLRLAQIIPNVPRVATRDLLVPGGPTLRAGCPFLINLEAISKSDPAVQPAGDEQQFKPER